MNKGCRVLMTLMISSLALFTACQEFSIESQPEMAPTYKIDAMEEYNVSASSPKSIRFNISSNSPWEIVSDSEWCKVNPAMSAASSLVAEITVTVDPNTTMENRTAVLKVSADNVDLVQEITVKQTAKESFEIIPFDGLVDVNGGKVTFKVLSNKPWKVLPSTQFLENIDKTSGTGNDKADPEMVTITVPQNAGAKRSAQIKVYTDYQEKVFTVTQDGILLELAEPLADGKLAVDPGMSESILGVNSNIKWKAEVDSKSASWLAVEAVSEKEIKIEVLGYNPIFIPRIGEIVLEPVDVIPGFEKVVIPVEQAVNFTFDPGVGKYEINQEDGSIKMIGAGGKGPQAISKSKIKKGSVKIEYKELHLVGGAEIETKFFTVDPGANYNFSGWLSHGGRNAIRIGGGFGWQNNLNVPKLSAEEFVNVKSTEWRIEDDPSNPDKLIIKYFIDNEQKAMYKNVKNVYASNPEYTGTVVYAQFPTTNVDSYYVIKSITFDPAE